MYDTNHKDRRIITIFRQSSLSMRPHLAINRCCRYFSIVMMALMLLVRPAWSDDTDILLACAPPVIDAKYRNLLFIMDDSSSMWSELAPGYTMWDAADNAFEFIMGFLPNVNVGLMMFGQGTMGGYVAYPVRPLDSLPLLPLHPSGTPSLTVREELIKIVKNNRLDQGTSTHGALEEAIRYLKGDTVFYGSRRLGYPVAPYPLADSFLAWRPYGDYTDDPDSHREFLSHPDSYTGGGGVTPSGCQWSNSYSCANERINGTATYKSPYDSQIGDSHVQIIMMIDGGPAGPNDISRINTMLGTTVCETPGESFDPSWGDDRCLRAFAKYLGTQTDLRPDLPGNQTASLTTIAFAVGSRDRDLLQDMSSLGLGSYFYAEDAIELKLAYQGAVGGPYEELPTDAVTFAQNAVVVDYDTGLEHGNDVYFPVLQPDTTPVWKGNLKRFDLQGDPPVLRGINGVKAFKDSTGKFNDAVKSFWTLGGSDGNDAADGGAAERLPDPLQRNLYVNINKSKALTHGHNALKIGNNRLKRQMFGTGVDNAYRALMINWLRGALPQQRFFMGDPLHSTPKIFVFGKRGDASQKKIAFMGTNQGYLHAIDAETGVEKWAFMPMELLTNVKRQLESSEGDGRIYGMDAPPVMWVDNKEPFNIVGDTDSNDTVLVIAGMRRGGQSYYAIDVTKPEVPTVIWKVSGTQLVLDEDDDDNIDEGEAVDDAIITNDVSTVTTLPKLAQTWSRPSRARVKLSASADPVDVLIFGGGYSGDTQDGATTRTVDTMGNAVYMVRVDNGKLVWMASNNGVGGSSHGGLTLADMKYSIPSDVATYDKNGLTQQFYVGDMGGQVWRFDIDNTAPTLSIKGGRIAELAGDTVQTHRKFFNKPDVALTVVNNQQKVAISLGSGSRPTPLNKDVEDHFYVLLNDYAPPSTYVTKRIGDLANRTSSLTGAADPDGWYIDLPGSGEKVLGKSITISNAVIFPTYTPPPPPGPGCSAFKTSKFWVMKLNSGKATKIFNDLNDPVTSRSIVVDSPGGLLPSPRLVITKKGPVVLSGTRQLFKTKNLGFPPSTFYPQQWEHVSD